jgi:hypothetical protein
LDHYSNGLSYPHVFKGTLKDEARSLKKIKEGKTRLFFASSLAHLIVQRMFLAPVFTLMLEFPGAFDTAIGVDMHRDGNRILDHFATFAKRPRKDFFEDDEIVEGDHEGFDQGPPVDITLGAYSVISLIAKELGYNEYAMRVLNTMLADLLECVFCLYGDMFIKEGIFPSGQYGTAEVNGIRNDLMMRYIAYYAFGNNHTFDIACKPNYYGDDLLMYILREYRHVFNTRVIAEGCKKYFSTGFTTASKDKSDVEFIPVKDMSFLKRTFKYSDILGRYVCPLEVSSLYKTLSFYMPSPVETPENQWMQMIDSVLRELVFHVDRDNHQKFRAGIADLFKQNTEVDPLPFLSDYDAIITSLQTEIAPSA